MKKRGRKSTFTDAAAEEICARLSKGEPLASICRDEHLPEVRTVADWKADHPEFAARFARARIDGFDAIADNCLEIADDRQDDPASRRVRVETRLKLLAKWDPKRYGERMAVDAEVAATVRVVLGGNAEEEKA